MNPIRGLPTVGVEITMAGDAGLTVLVRHVGGDRVTRQVTLPLVVSAQETALPAAGKPAEPVVSGIP